jgi:hypothetical protein
MDERTGQLDEALVKISVDAGLIREPQIFEDIMRLVKKLAIEAVEITEVMGIQFLSPEGLNHQGDTRTFRTFVTHTSKI